MEKPEYAPIAIGEIMMECWKHNQDERISFPELERTLGEMVDPSTRQRFAAVPEPEGSAVNYMQMTIDQAPKMDNYLHMTNAEETANTPSNYQNLNLISPKKPPKLATQLSVTYINTSIDMTSTPTSPLSSARLKER